MSARILVIDNDETLALGIAGRLERSGYWCVTAGSGEEGLTVFASGGIDLVITDLNMPGGDGISVLETIRETTPRVPVVVITGYSQAYRDRLRDIPHVSCLQKPFKTDALIDLVETELALAGIES